VLEFAGHINRVGEKEASFKISDASGLVLENRAMNCPDLATAVKALILWLTKRKDQFPLFAIGHRLVQGGPDHLQPELITPKLLIDLKEYIDLAPNHLPDEISTIHAFGSAYPEARQVACFDTHFHRDMPAFVKKYPLPAEYQGKGLLKYGFHGLSYNYIMDELAARDPQVLTQKIVIAHLGNGASMAAVHRGTGIDTTMGVSPIGGLVMGTRSGDLDPGVLFYLLKQYQITPAGLEELLSKHSGLLGLSGTSDVQELIRQEAKNKTAATALQVFCYSAKKHIGSLAAALEGLDMLVFTGGIGENSALIRESICRGLDFMGITLHDQKNLNNELTISNDKSRVTVHVIKTNEELMMARLVRAALHELKT